MVNAGRVLNLCLGNNRDLVFIFEKRFPHFAPDGMKCIPASNNMDPFGPTAGQDLFWDHLGGGRHRKTGVQMEIGVVLHGYYPIYRRSSALFFCMVEAMAETSVIIWEASSVSSVRSALMPVSFSSTSKTAVELTGSTR